MARRKHAIRITAALALGVFTTIALAWSLACMDIPDQGIEAAQRIFPERGPLTYDPMNGPPNGIRVTMYRASGRISVSASANGPDRPFVLGFPAEFFTPAKVPPDQLVPWTARSLALPWLDHADPRPWPRGGDTDWRETEASGWPLLALASVHERTASFTRERSWGIPLPGKNTRKLGNGLFGPGSPRVLPLRPLWTGLCLDTLLYALAWLALLLIPPTLRTRSRRRRNRCTHCNYDRTGLAPSAVCPECGTPSNMQPHP